MTAPELPAPLVLAEVDLRCMPVPRDMLIELGMSQFGLTAQEASDLIEQIEPFLDTPIGPGGCA